MTGTSTGTLACPLGPEHRVRVWKFYGFWFWKCRRAQCGHWGWGRDWKAAFTRAHAHAEQENRQAHYTRHTRRSFRGEARRGTREEHA